MKTLCPILLLVLLGVLAGCSSGPYEGLLRDLPAEEAEEVRAQERQRGHDAGVDDGCRLLEWIIAPADLLNEIEQAYAETVRVYADPALASEYRAGYDEGRRRAKSVMGALLGDDPC